MDDPLWKTDLVKVVFVFWFNNFQDLWFETIINCTQGGWIRDKKFCLVNLEMVNSVLNTYDVSWELNWQIFLPQMKNVLEVYFSYYTQFYLYLGCLLLST